MTDEIIGQPATIGKKGKKGRQYAAYDFSNGTGVGNDSVANGVSGIGGVNPNIGNSSVGGNIGTPGVGYNNNNYPQQNFAQNAYPGNSNMGTNPSANLGGNLYTPGLNAPNGVGNNQNYYPDNNNIDNLNSQFGNLGIQQNGIPTPGAPMYGNPNEYSNNLNNMNNNMNINNNNNNNLAGSNPHLPLNQLFTVDLLQQIPPPINDLLLKPPPIVLPPNLAVTDSKDSNAPPEYFRSTLNVVPTTSSLLKRSKLSLGLIIQPFISLRDEDAPVPVISDTIISRCRRCRTYIHPFVLFLDQGRRWRCNICNLTNDVPSGFDWNQIEQRAANRWERSELNHSVVEFIAPSEYMVRPPQPILYLFLIDVSAPSVASGLLATTARTILESLDRIPNANKRARIGFIGVDSNLYFFSIPPPPSNNSRSNDNTDENNNYDENTTNEPTVVPEPVMHVVGDIEDPFLPVPNNLIVNLAECRASIELLLTRIGDMFANNAIVHNAMGPALKAAHTLISPIGGKIICLMASRPDKGIGKLAMREDRNVLGTNKENSLLQTSNSFYKSFAVDCSKSQISVDMFLFSSTYQDVASLSNLPRYTAGQTYYYPSWNAGRPEDAIKLAHDLSEHLSAEIGLEAVMRVRASNGLRMSNFYGNFFNRSSDLCAFPAFPRDQTYVVEVAIDDTIGKQTVCFQTAVLHTASSGERRIRVMTLVLPTSSSLADIYASADQLALTAFYTQKCVEKALRSGLQDARNALTNKLVEILTVYKKELVSANVGASAPMQLCGNLRLLPVLFLALQKHIGLRKSSRIGSDTRSAALDLLSTLCVDYLIQYIYPDFYSLHDMSDECGLPDSDPNSGGAIIMPQKLNLSADKIEHFGLYLIDDGQTQFLYIGRDAVPQLIMDVFGLSSLDQVKTGKTTLPLLDNDFSRRVNAIIAKSRERLGSINWPNLYIVREDGDPALRLWAATELVEDRVEEGPSYVQFLTSLRNSVNS